MTAAEGAQKPSLGERWPRTAAVFLDPRVLIILLLGFSSGLPLALSGSTLLLWMKDVGVDLGTIGLFALVGVPTLSSFYGRRSSMPSRCRSSGACSGTGAAGSCSRSSCSWRQRPRSAPQRPCTP